MDYSKFVTAVNENDRSELDRLSVIISRVLMKFLRARLNASQEDAEDCVQSTLLQVIKTIRDDKLNNPDSIIYYMFTAAKNEYFKVLSKRKEDIYEETPHHYYDEPGQLMSLLDKERQRILEYCVSKLKPAQISYISYWFENPADDAGSVAKHFNISLSNAWTRKHRIIQILKSCVTKNINL